VIHFYKRFSLKRVLWSKTCVTILSSIFRVNLRMAVK